MNKRVPLLINGQFVDSKSAQSLPVINPATQGVLADVPFATQDEVEQAIQGAAEAFKTWRNVPVPERARLMLRYQALLKEHHDELAEILAE
ncbi:aldehyde dehydrogenase family protein, partial [Litorivivens sp.]